MDQPVIDPGTLERVCRERLDAARRNYQRAPDRAWPHFIPELHVPRRRISEVFDRFLDTERAVFVLEGPSGSGKSSEMLRLAEERVDHDFVLFLRLTKGDCEVAAPLERELDCADLSQALARAARSAGRRALLFIDNADACDPTALSIELNRLALRIEAARGAVRMIVACRPRTWRSLSRDDELESPLARGRGSGEPEQPEGTNVQMPPLRGSELDGAFELGAKYYRVTGALTERLERLCASPELLRLLLMSSRDQTLLPGDESDVFARLYVGSKRSGIDALKAVAEHIVEANIRRAGRLPPILEVSREEVLDRLRVADLDAALDRGLLEAAEDEHGRASISFRAQWVLDYCVAFYGLRLDMLSRDQLAERVSAFRKNIINADALAWFLGNAELETIRAAYRAQEDGARRYAEAFTRIARDFPCIAEGGPQASITLIADPAWGDVWHDLRWLPAGSPAVEWSALDLNIPYEWRVVAAASKMDEKARPQIARDFFLSSNLEERAAEEVSGAWENFWQDRDLDPIEFFGLDIVRELAWAIAVAHTKELQLDRKKRTFSIEAVSSGARLHPRRRVLNNSFPLQTLDRALARLRAAGVAEIDHPLGDPDEILSLQEYPEDLEGQESLRRIFTRLFERALAEYRAAIPKLFSPRIIEGLDIPWLHPLRIEIDVMNPRELDPHDDRHLDLAVLLTRAEEDQIAVRFIADRAENVVERALDARRAGQTPPNILGAWPSKNVAALLRKPFGLTLEKHASTSTEERTAILWLLVSRWIADTTQKNRTWLREQVRAAALPGRTPLIRAAPKVFISYGTPDEPFARRLHTALQHLGIDTFFFPKTATPGSPIDQVVRDAIHDCDHLILVSSRASLDRNGVLAEITELLAREMREGGTRRLIPARLDDYVLREWSPERPDMARSVRDRVMIDFSGALHNYEIWDQKIAELAEVLRT